MSSDEALAVVQHAQQRRGLQVVDRSQEVNVPTENIAGAVRDIVSSTHGAIEGMGATDISIELDVNQSADGKSSARFRLRAYRAKNV